MRFRYNLGYDDKDDTFYAYVEDWEHTIVFEIDGSEEMSALIRGGFMKHVDDIAGLHKFLVRVRVLEKWDVMILGDVC